MAAPNNDKPQGAPTEIHIRKNKSVNWLGWALLALGVLAALLALSRCHRDDTAAVTNTSTTVVGRTPNAGKSEALTGTSELGGYLAGSDVAPRTFAFEKLNFDTARSEVRPADATEIDEVAATLKRYASAKIRIAGYADARGSETANMALGKARAESIKTFLVNRGIDAARIETASGGESDPVDSNATAGGRFENRRTELVVISR